MAGFELGAQAEPRVRASIEDSKPDLFTINHQDWMGSLKVNLWIRV